MATDEHGNTRFSLYGQSVTSVFSMATEEHGCTRNYMFFPYMSNPCISVFFRGHKKSQINLCFCSFICNFQRSAFADACLGLLSFSFKAERKSRVFPARVHPRRRHFLPCYWRSLSLREGRFLSCMWQRKMNNRNFFAQTLGCLIYNVYLCNILCERLNLKHIININ